MQASNGYTPYHWAERLSNEEVAQASLAPDVQSNRLFLLSNLFHSLTNCLQELQRLGADNRFVGGWMFGSRSTNDTMPFVSFLANRFFGSIR